MGTTDWNAWFAELKARKDREAAELLQKAKDEAHSKGKEPFDLELFDSLWPDNPSLWPPLGSKPLDPPPPRELRLRRWERDYYLLFPEFRTVQEFADYMRDRELDGYFD